MRDPYDGSYAQMDAGAEALGVDTLASGETGFEPWPLTTPVVGGGSAMSKRGLRNDGVNGSKSRTSGRQWNADQKFRIVIESLTSPEANTKICRRHGISEPTLYKWRQQFFDGGKLYLSGAARPNAADLARENRRLKEIIGETLLALRNGLGERSARRSRLSWHVADGPEREM
jgi:transposase